MGLFSFIKKNMLKVVEWLDDSNETIVYRFPLSDRYEIMKGSKLVVRESQVAIFVQEGKIADVFVPGTYTLDTNNLPILCKIKAWKYAFETPFKGDVYFVNTKQFTGRRWGTTNPVLMRDDDFGVIRLRGYGMFSFKVSDPAVLLKEVFGTNRLYTVGEIEAQLKNYIVSEVSDAIAESGIGALDIAGYYTELGDIIKKRLGEKFSALGLSVETITVENISLPEEVEKSIDTRSSLGILGDKMGTYTQFKAANAMEAAAENPAGSGLAGAGVGLGAGFVMGDVMKGAMVARDEQRTVACPKCGASVAENARFCPECGEKIKVEMTCAKCGAKLAARAKFCPECGEKIGPKKCECGADLTGERFCPECGKKQAE